MKYFVSYCVIKGGNTNSLGHAYLTISQLDENDGPDARVEVIEAFGFYGDPFDRAQTIARSLLPGRLFGQGHLKREHLRYLIKTDYQFQYHKTWQITEHEKNKLLNDFEIDSGIKLAPRNFGVEKAEWDYRNRLRINKNPHNLKILYQLKLEEESHTRQAKGAYFNILKHSCMTDMKDRLHSIGINTDQMDGYIMDIPGLTSGPLDAMKLSYENGKVYWNSPFTLSQRSKTLDPLTQKYYNSLRHFSILHAGIEKVHELFTLKMRELREQKNTSFMLQANQKIKTLLEKSTVFCNYPNRINDTSNQDLENELRILLIQYHNQLVEKDKNDVLATFIRDVVDIIYIFFVNAFSFYAKPTWFMGKSEFAFAKQALVTVDEMNKNLSHNMRLSSA